MYTKEYFDKYPLLKNTIKKYGMNNFLDPLTKTVLRGHIMNFIDLLIDSKIPFVMIIMDIDNFKQINDNYGHHIGDLVLEETAKNIIDIVGDYGIVGRYGGDEFIIVDFVHTNYDSIHKFLESFYSDTGCDGVFRRLIYAEQTRLFITGTIGTSNYPDDAKDFDDLFNKADKALYRGKMKGRNCFIIYVHEKHKDIDIYKLIKEPIQNTFSSLFEIFDSKKDINHRRIEAFNYVKKILKISDAHYFNSKNQYNEDNNIVINDLDVSLDETNVCIYNNMEGLDTRSIELQNFINDKMIASMLIGKIIYKDTFFGYVILGENNTQRIWQNEDVGIMVVLMRLLGEALFEGNK